MNKQTIVLPTDHHIIIIRETKQTELKKGNYDVNCFLPIYLMETLGTINNTLIVHFES